MLLSSSANESLATLIHSSSASKSISSWLTSSSRPSNGTTTSSLNHYTSSSRISNISSITNSSSTRTTDVNKSHVTKSATLSTTPIIRYPNATIQMWNYLNVTLRALGTISYDAYTSSWDQKIGETLRPVVIEISRWNAAISISGIVLASAGLAYSSSRVAQYNESVSTLIQIIKTKQCFLVHGKFALLWTVAGVSLKYWPTPYPNSAITALVDLSNFDGSTRTLYRSDIYATFYDIGAFDNCGVVTEHVGKYPLWNAWGFMNSTDLSTSTFATNGAGLGVWQSLNLTDLQAPPLGVFDPPGLLTQDSTLLEPTGPVTKPTSTSGSPSTGPPAFNPTPTTNSTTTSPKTSLHGPPPQTPTGVTTTASTTTQTPVRPVTITAVIASGTDTITSVFTSTPSSPPVISISNPAVTAPPTEIIILEALTINGYTITANTQGNFVLAGTTITADSQGNIILDGQTITAGGPAVIISESTISLSPRTTEIVVGTQTLIVGGSAVTISGTVYSLEPGGTRIVVGTLTANLGSIILSIFGAAPSAPLQFTGAAGRIFWVSVVEISCVVVVASVLMVWL
ncbi:uncharacterized protein PAC_08224 [Phialocephala subalpina]|uniref:Uncharacterized protein n=1 Tax=Phialocephala subalpina TaxID=576137 RepID=A0A1L7WZY6_9HELO|nr:uncharacterized protein PAC_08224 [Phialocephala subalpina]